MKLETYNGFNVGSTFVILEKPITWSSGLNGKYPLNRKYPLIGNIVAIEDEIDFVTMNDDKGYGYSLDELVRENIITNNLKIIRKFKLNKIERKLCGKH